VLAGVATIVHLFVTGQPICRLRRRTSGSDSSPGRRLRGSASMSSELTRDRKRRLWFRQASKRGNPRDADDTTAPARAVAPAPETRRSAIRRQSRHARVRGEHVKGEGPRAAARFAAARAGRRTGAGARARRAARAAGTGRGAGSRIGSGHVGGERQRADHRHHQRREQLLVPVAGGPLTAARPAAPARGVIRARAREAAPGRARPARRERSGCRRSTGAREALADRVCATARPAGRAAARAARPRPSWRRRSAWGEGSGCGVAGRSRHPWSAGRASTLASHPTIEHWGRRG
jgi:hypothetical protein